MALSDERLDAMRQADNGALNFVTLRQFRAIARAIEAEARRDALEEAAQLVEKATYRKRWVKAGVNGQASNTPPCALAAAIRKLKEDTQ